MIHYLSKGSTLIIISADFEVSPLETMKVKASSSLAPVSERKIIVVIVVVNVVDILINEEITEVGDG